MRVMVFCLTMNQCTAVKPLLPVKIIHGIANIALGMDPYLHLGNMDTLRDWDYVKDYVRRDD